MGRFGDNQPHKTSERFGAKQAHTQYWHRRSQLTEGSRAGAGWSADFMWLVAPRQYQTGTCWNPDLVEL
jgi:hypothetical protein